MLRMYVTTISIYVPQKLSVRIKKIRIMERTARRQYISLKYTEPTKIKFMLLRTSFRIMEDFLNLEF